MGTERPPPERPAPLPSQTALTERPPPVRHAPPPSTPTALMERPLTERHAPLPSQTALTERPLPEKPALPPSEQPYARKHPSKLNERYILKQLKRERNRVQTYQNSKEVTRDFGNFY